MTSPDMQYKPVLSRICGIIPQDMMTELATVLASVYNINQNGGHGSRRKVSQMLLEIGVNPNSRIEALFRPAQVRIRPMEVDQ